MEVQVRSAVVMVDAVGVGGSAGVKERVSSGDGGEDVVMGGCGCGRRLCDGEGDDGCCGAGWSDRGGRR
ncbi:hypothetical protein F0562_012777 [Nyssa sinensis]|uniref:Uncharacterized protein n=1 Tax=Nyssa sinensis TaxID=561372 RepID=A0A5J4ZV52_9ASTE|nr:hypothetical protein F0562_012777 [Nyssa sinensis]